MEEMCFMCGERLFQAQSAVMENAQSQKAECGTSTCYSDG